MSKARCILLGLLAVLALEAVATATASAHPGPFWWHREATGKGLGEKLKEGAVETYKAKSTNDVFSAEIGGAKLELTGETNATGGIWNVPNQGQLKAQVTFSNVHPVGLPNCNVTVTVPEDYIGHLMWKYRGNAKELSQTITQTEAGQEWDAILVPAKTVLGANGLSGKNVFAVIKIPIANCGVFGGMSLKPEGASGFSDMSLPLGAFTKTATVTFPGHSIWQHYWNGTEVKTLEEGLFSGITSASFNGTLTIEFTTQEIDVVEL